MAVNECIPLYPDDDAVTCRAVTAVTGGRFLALAPVGGAGLNTDAHGAMPNVAHCGAAGPVFGVSGYDCAAGGDVTVWRSGPGDITPVESGGVFAAGDAVVSDATGRAVKGASGVSGFLALQASTAAGQHPAIDRRTRLANP
jgi:hypothetical protein